MLKKILFWLILSIFALVGIVCIIFAVTLNQINREGTEVNHDNLNISASGVEDIKNVAFFGVDAREDVDKGRSDAIMIVSLDSVHSKVKVISIMRDSYVPIDGLGKAKINSAYAYGGAELAIRTLNTCFDMDISDYVTVNFNQLAGVIDALGGVEIDISEAERKNANKYIKEMCKEVGITDYPLIESAGIQTLYGYQAVAYSRIRYVGNSDFERTERQQEVLEKLMNKVLSANILEYPSIISKVSPMVETSMSNSEIVSIAAKMLLGGRPEFVHARIPKDGEYSSKNYNMIYDLDKTGELIHDFIYNDADFYENESKESEEK